MDSLREQDRAKRRITLGIYGFMMLYFVLKECYCAVFIAGFPDQMVHLSYIVHMARCPSLLPDFSTIPVYYVVSEQGNLVQLAVNGGIVNYLCHPPLYYLLMSLSGAVRITSETTATVNLMALRFCNVLLSSAAMALAFRLGYTRLKGRSPLVHALFACAVATLPELGYVGAGLNNDNLAFLALVLFFTGLLRYEEDCLDWKTYLLIGTGFFLGAFAKVTMALVFAAMLGVVLIMSILRTRSLKLILNRRFLICLPAFGLFLIYEVLVHQRWGAWQPSLETIAPDYFYTTVFYVPPEQRTPVTFLQYVGIFTRGVAHSWSSLNGHNQRVNEIMDNGVFGVVYWIPVALAFFAAVRRIVRREPDRISLPVVLSFLFTLVFHFWSKWKALPATGYLGGVKARYYLAMIVPLAFLMCRDIPPLFRSPSAKRAGQVLAVLLIGYWIGGDWLRLLFTVGFQL